MSYFIFAVSLLSYELFVIYLKQALYPIHFASHNFFFLELISITGHISDESLFLLGIGGLTLIWLISRQIFKNHYSLIPPIIYAISPWGSYSVVAASFYIYLSFLLLLIFYGLLLIKSGKTLWGSILAVVASGISMYSSFILLLLLPIIFVLLIVFKIIPFNSLKFPLMASILLALPLFSLIYNNQSGFKDISSNEIKMLSDQGLLNSVNSYQGAAKQAGFGKLAKISENKYVFTAEYIFLKYIKQLVPTTYFTQQERLLNFSFSSPIYLGFLIPFLYGLYKILQSSILRKTLLLSTLIVIPSILSKQIVDLNRLIIFAPVIILVISYGLMKLDENRNKVSFFLILALILVIFQFLVTLSDIQLREKARFTKYYEFEQNYEIGKQ